MDICKNSNNFTNVSNAEMSAVELNKPVNEKETDNNQTLLKDNSSFTGKICWLLKLDKSHTIIF